MFRRKGRKKENDILVLLNVSPHVYEDERYTVRGKLVWKEIFNSNNVKYWGSGEYLNTNLEISIKDKKAKVCEIKIAVPALSAMIFR